MLNQLVKVTLSGIDGINEDMELFIESISKGIAVGHTKGDRPVKFDMTDIVSLVVVEDEDEMQSFVSDMLMNRKDFQISEIANRAVNDFAKIQQYCPETCEILLQQLHGAIEDMIEGYD